MCASCEDGFSTNCSRWVSARVRPGGNTKDAMIGTGAVAGNGAGGLCDWANSSRWSACSRASIVRLWASSAATRERITEFWTMSQEAPAMKIKAATADANWYAGFHPRRKARKDRLADVCGASAV